MEGRIDGSAPSGATLSNTTSANARKKATPAIRTTLFLSCPSCPSLQPLITQVLHRPLGPNPSRPAGLLDALLGEAPPLAVVAGVGPLID